MVRWPIQGLSLIAFVTALWGCFCLWRQQPMFRPHLAFVLPWLVIEVLFNALLVGRVIWYGGESPLSPPVTWVANVVHVSTALTIALTLWRASRRHCA